MRGLAMVVVQVLNAQATQLWLRGIEDYDQETIDVGEWARGVTGRWLDKLDPQMAEFRGMIDDILVKATTAAAQLNNPAREGERWLTAQTTTTTSAWTG